MSGKYFLILRNSGAPAALLRLPHLSALTHVMDGAQHSTRGLEWGGGEIDHKTEKRATAFLCRNILNSCDKSLLLLSSDAGARPRRFAPFVDTFLYGLAIRSGTLDGLAFGHHV